MRARRVQTRGLPGIMPGMTSAADNLHALLRAARQLLDAERSLGGAALPVNLHPLPEPAPRAASLEAAPPPASPEPVTLRQSARPAAGAPQADGQPREVPMTRDEKQAILDQLDREQVKGCTRCGLCQSRTNTVFGEGDPDADLMFVGEGPGQDEDLAGRPFVGRAGQKLDEMIAAMGLGREQVYIANVVKCRPPGNRTPLPDEARACWPYLERQIEVIQPKVIVVLGNAAAKMLLDTPVGITKLRGQWQRFGAIDVMPTFHPAYLLRQYTPENRRRVWEDLQQVMQRLGLQRR